MKLKDEERWFKYVEVNQDEYSKACVTVARRVMEILDERTEELTYGYYPDLNTAHGIICQADDDTNAGGITGFMASAVAQIVFECHERGEEFKESYNGKEKSNGVVDTSILSINT